MVDSGCGGWLVCNKVIRDSWVLRRGAVSVYDDDYDYD